MPTLLSRRDTLLLLLFTRLQTLSSGIADCRYKYEWKLEEAQKNILRTHTTAVSARMLYKLGQQVSVNTVNVYMSLHLHTAFHITFHNQVHYTGSMF